MTSVTLRSSLRPGSRVKVMSGDSQSPQKFRDRLYQACDGLNRSMAAVLPCYTMNLLDEN